MRLNEILRPCGGFEIAISSRRFPFENENTGGVLKSPFFKDTAVSGRYRCVLFHFPPT